MHSAGVWIVRSTSCGRNRTGEKNGKYILPSDCVGPLRELIRHSDALCRKTYYIGPTYATASNTPSTENALRRCSKSAPRGLRFFSSGTPRRQHRFRPAWLPFRDKCAQIDILCALRLWPAISSTASQKQKRENMVKCLNYIGAGRAFDRFVTARWKKRHSALDDAKTHVRYEYWPQRRDPPQIPRPRCRPPSILLQQPDMNPAFSWVAKRRGRCERQGANDSLIDQRGIFWLRNGRSRLGDTSSDSRDFHLRCLLTFIVSLGLCKCVCDNATLRFFVHW